MAVGFDDDECVLQDLSRIPPQDMQQFVVQCLYGIRPYAQVQHATMEMAGADQGTEIAVAGQQQAIPRSGFFKQLGVTGPAATDVPSLDQIEAVLGEESFGCGIDVLVEEKSHRYAARK